MKKCLEIISLWLPVIHCLPIKSKYLEGVLAQHGSNNGSFFVFSNGFLSQKESIDTIRYRILMEQNTMSETIRNRPRVDPSVTGGQFKRHSLFA